MKKANVNISKSQAAEIAVAVQEKKKPAAVIHTTVSELPNIIELERQKVKADFAIVTDPKQPAKQVKPAELPRNSKVVFNQYNVKAYPQHLLLGSVYCWYSFFLAFFI